MSIIPIAIVTEWGREEWYGILGNVHCRAPLDKLMVVVYTLGNKIKKTRILTGQDAGSTREKGSDTNGRPHKTIW
ncbi:MAG: hypothetical protein V3U04_05565 [Candidatus Aerophobetes bacterium]